MSDRRARDRRKNLALPKFRCPICEELTIAAVVNGRRNLKKRYYWRRLKCTICHQTYTTKEVVEPLNRPSRAAQDVSPSQKQAHS